MFAACILSFGIGFLLLGQEVLWLRLFGFANHSLPQSYIYVMSIYLLGVGAGAIFGGVLCRRDKNLWENSGFVLLLASLAGLLAPWFYAYTANTEYQILFGTCAMLLMASLNAVLFPIVYHLGVPPEGPYVGRATGLVYLIYIIGAALGPLIAGYIMLDAMTTQDCFAVCAELTFVLSMFCFRDDFQPAMMIVGSAFAAMILGFVVASENTEMMGLAAANAGNIHRIIENRYGVLVTYDGGMRGDAVYEGNVYAGRTSIDPIINSNFIDRTLIMAALQDHPENVLMLGLSIGSGLKLVTTFPGVKKIDVVEVNPGYLDAITDYPQLQAGLIDSRVHLHIDGGRRWLRNHPEQKYDLIIVNRTGLLSREFLLMLKQHMQENAVLTFNYGESVHVLKTAKTIFLYAYPYEGFIIAADFDWRDKMRDPASMKKLGDLNFDGKLIFPPGSDVFIAKYLHYPQDLSDPQTSTAEIITDRNLLTEFKQGKNLFTPLPIAPGK